jgi:PAS domain S-box-containing protein
MGIGASSLPKYVGLVLIGWLHFCNVRPVASAGGSEKPKTVVVLYPDANDGRPGHVLADRGIRSTFAGSAFGTVEIHGEHLDLSRFPDPNYQKDVADFLKRKYSGRKIDLVIAGLASGLDFALKHREQVFAGVPIVFCAVDEQEVKTRNLPTDVIGVPIKMDLAATLDVALHLQPRTQRVYVITGKSQFDRQWETEARRVFHAYEDKVEFIHLAGLPMPDLLKQVAELPENSIVYYVHLFQDGHGKVLVPAEALKLVAAKANAPIYGHVDTYVGRGIVGGRVFSFEMAGKNAAALGLRILAGEKAEVIGIQGIADNPYMFDARELRRWSIDQAHLPPGSDVRHHEPGFWELYRWQILGVVSLCVVETLLIFGLLVQRASRRRAERRFQLAVEAAPNGMLMVGQDGTIALVNAAMEILFGYRKDEMLGQPVEMLLPVRFQSQHPDHRLRFFAAPEARPMGAGRELFGRRKDGSEFPVEIGLSPVRTDAGLFVLASIIDISERRRAEEDLRRSQSELRELTGRLLLAQETERRRIARELHDDLNQSLAILAVELDMLIQRPPESAAEIQERIQKLSAQIKQLSSSVHDLSHQLHPAKLEQLGVVAALRSLCQELTNSHGLPIGFEHDEIPERLPDDAALCLYRITQECLQNVIKHSAAHHVEVVLKGHSDSLILRVVDDGIGFDSRSLDGKAGLGLASMRERLRLVDGEFAIDSRPGSGTRIEVRVPLTGATSTRIDLKEDATTVG